MALKTGTRLGSYEITSLLGVGGMGEVYQARDTKLGREVAIKVLPEAFAEDKERLARFEREARLLASLNHPNIATLFDLQEHDAAHFLVLELVPGEDLRERFERGAISIDEALPLFKQIAEALEAAHATGVVHRDLKPANIKITPEGKVKVLDFGLAKALVGDESAVDSSQSPTLTKGTAMGAIMGTAAYMSPEQARGKKVDKRTDIWAFGCCLYEALTGRKAFGGETVTDVLAAVVKTDPDWQSLPDTTPWKIRELLERCLRKDPSRRIHDMADARIDLDDALVEPPIGRLPPPWVDPRGAAARIALIAFAAAALSAIVTWLLVRAPTPTEQITTRLTVTLPEGQTFAGRAHPFAVSPDGMRFAYAAEAGGTQQLYLRHLDDFEAKLLPGTEGASSPFFSPDGRWVGFYADGYVKKTSTTGGAPITICEASPYMSRDRGAGVSWQNDNTIIFGNSTGGLFVIPADGGTPDPLTSPQTAVGHFWPQMLPDGKHILYSEFDYSGGSLLALLSTETGQSRDLIRGNITTFQARYLSTGHLVYAQSGGLWAVPFHLSRLELTGSPVSVLEGVQEVLLPPNGPTSYFALADTGTLFYVPGGVMRETLLVWVDRDGGETRWIEGEGDHSNPRLSPDGTRVAVALTSPEGADIWIYDVDRGTRTRLTFGGFNYEPVWSRDGTRVAFAGPNDTFWVPADGSGTAQPLVQVEGTSSIVPSSWSPDGRTLTLYDIHPSTGRDIYVAPVDGEPKPTPILVTEFNEHSAMFSPDGRWLAYVSDESGREEVYIRALSGPGAKHVVSTEGGREPTWSVDGRELFYRNGDKMMAVAIVTEPDFTSGTPKVLFEGHYAMGYGGGNNYDVTPDGRRFLMVRSDLESAPNQINVVLNWAEELKRLVPTN